jgi:hypothetical protein
MPLVLLDTDCALGSCVKGGWVAEMETSLLAACVAISSPKSVRIVAIIELGLRTNCPDYRLSVGGNAVVFYLQTGWSMSVGRFISCLRPVL